MAILVGQLIEILQRYDRDREVTIHTLKGETVEVNGYFVQKRFKRQCILFDRFRCSSK